MFNVVPRCYLFFLSSKKLFIYCYNTDLANVWSQSSNILNSELIHGWKPKKCSSHCVTNCVPCQINFILLFPEGQISIFTFAYTTLLYWDQQNRPKTSPLNQIMLPCVHRRRDLCPSSGQDYSMFHTNIWKQTCFYLFFFTNIMFMQTRIMI